MPLQGAETLLCDTQGVASLALGYVLHWAFSPPLLNPKLELRNTPLGGEDVTIRQIESLYPIVVILSAIGHYGIKSSLFFRTFAFRIKNVRHKAIDHQ